MQNIDYNGPKESPGRQSSLVSHWSSPAQIPWTANHKLSSLRNLFSLRPVQEATTQPPVSSMKHDSFFQVIGVVIFGRSALVEDIEAMLAPCITTIPLRVSVGEPRVFPGIAYRTHAEMSSAMEYQQTPLRLTQGWVGSSEPLFEAPFTFNRTSSSHSSSSLCTSVESKAILDVNVKAIMSRVAELFSHLDTPFGALPDLAGTDADIDAPEDDATSWSEVEIDIRDKVAEACRVDKETSTEGIHLGIDSITRIRLAQQLRNAGIPAFAIMRHNCVEKLAEFVASNQSGTARVGRNTRHFTQGIQQLRTPRLIDDDGISLFPRLLSRPECHRKRSLRVGVYIWCIIISSSIRAFRLKDCETPGKLPFIRRMSCDVPFTSVQMVIIPGLSPFTA
ncbi:hypothetical protein D9757_009428 [Collybiopsis confluens]|uniref:Carrier domain-containing protein n=1 Tax=Collybiopsis confluens TaxID=2823264 RepID=A0A8H5HDS5_9AGAR|nr:hypothetical protein D9757_009428 [Collybiopsis confluens]